MPLPNEETTPPVMKTNRVMGGRYTQANRSLGSPLVTESKISWLERTAPTAAGGRRGRDGDVLGWRSRLVQDRMIGIHGAAINQRERQRQREKRRGQDRRRPG